MRFSPHARFLAESDHSFWSYLPLSDENFTLENLHHNIYRTRIGVCLCYKQQSGIQSCHGACWLPALSNTYRHDRNLPYLPTASRLLPRFSKVLYKVIMSLLLLIHDKAAKVVTSRAFKINIKKNSSSTLEKKGSHHVHLQDLFQNFQKGRQHASAR